MRPRKFFRKSKKVKKSDTISQKSDTTTTDFDDTDDYFSEDSARYTDTSWQIHRHWWTGKKERFVPPPSSTSKHQQQRPPESELSAVENDTETDDTLKPSDTSKQGHKSTNKDQDQQTEKLIKKDKRKQKVRIQTQAIVHSNDSTAIINQNHKTKEHNNNDGESTSSSESETSVATSSTISIHNQGNDEENSHIFLHIHETSSQAASAKNGAKIKQTTAVMTSQPRLSYRMNRNEGMDLSYVTERIIALWFPSDIAQSTYRQGQRQAAHMLHNKHGNNYMVFNLSEPRRAARSEHERVREVGWPSDLAPPLEGLCTICKDIDSWLSADKQRIAVLHARGSRERLGVVVAAYMHYSSICGTADQALDRFAMRRFLDDTVSPNELPSNKRYVEYFSGLLSGHIRINLAPLYLTHVTVLGAPAFDSPGGCRAFLKIYEGLIPVYTSGIYCVSGNVRQFTVNIASERQRRGLQLRGDILVKCYHRRSNSRETIFSCQFHTCAVSDYTLSFTRQELDVASNDLRFPLDGAVELHFSPTPDIRLPSPAPTPAIPVDFSDDRIVRYNSYENLGAETTEEESDPDATDADVNHTYGPLDGSIYATIAKKPDLSPGSAGGVISSPLTVSMDSGISSAGHQQASSHGAPLSNNTSNESSSSPPPHHHHHQSGQLLTPEDRHRELDELLSDMLLTVESIPDLKPGLRGNTPPQPPLQYRNDIITCVNSSSSSGSMTSQQHQQRSTTPSRSRNQSANGLSCEETLKSVIHTLDSVSYIDDDCGVQTNSATLTLDDIPYHARQDSRPFTYGTLPAEGSMIGAQTGLASPSLVRKASIGKSSTYNRNGTTLDYDRKISRNHHDPIDDIFTSRANESFRREEYGGSVHRGHETLRRSNTEGTLRRPVANGTSTYSKTTVTSPYSDSESLSPPSGFGRSFRNSHQTVTTPRSPEFHESSFTSTTTASTNSNNNSNLTWLQRQQQKLKERREIQLREERQPHETRLISELRSSIQHTSTHRHMRPTASHRLDGYTSDTTAFADDDDDFTIPLHINTQTITSSTTKTPQPSGVSHNQSNNNTSSNNPISPMLPNRTSSRKYNTTNSNVTQSQNTSINQSSTLGRQERPFVAVKRAHEQKQNSDISPSSSLASNPMGHIIQQQQRTESRSVDSIDSGLLSVVEQQQQKQEHQRQHQNYNGNNNGNQNNDRRVYREESFSSSWRTTSASEAEGSPPPTSTSPRPQTPAFPVHPRTPYSNNSVHFDLSQGGLPPKSPTTQRRMSYPSSTSHRQSKKWISESPSKDISPLTNGNTTEYSTTTHHTIAHSNTPQSTNSNAYQENIYQQHSPKSPTYNGSSSPTVYYGHSRRSSIHSNSEPPQEVSAAHVKFVRDTSKLWYKPTISREEAINLLRDAPPGTFVVRDSNSFPGAFGMALKVATPPPNVQTKSNNGDELVRHFLIEPTSRGVRLKGCSNEPVFSSLSALVYQHSVMPLALPCRLALPEGDPSKSSDASNTLTTTQQLLQQGAACNVLYLYTVDMESLTGPQAIRKAVQQLFMQRPLPKATVVHFKVSGQGITLTDNKRKLFFRRHYPYNTISHCGLDPDDHRWSHSSDETGMPISSNRCFGFVARKPASSSVDNQCHIFAELEPEQPATAIVNFVSKVMTHCQGKANIV
ncbi:tensin-1 isoform X3 [Chrysoperla carnea]|uniref:tensin-1 isoform X3 n=1 Tax=Chrysoperla carnea TaxID=189513 RepID=UPI001D08F264|nr:tensin-1 isoform X3 [Chrysoperla carnea]